MMIRCVPQRPGMELGLVKEGKRKEGNNLYSYCGFLYPTCTLVLVLQSI